MSMAFGIENRFAFLDPPLVELVAPMAPGWKLRGGFTKWLLRKAVDPWLPREICWQKSSQSTGRDEYGDWLKRDLHPQIAQLCGGDLAAVELGLLDGDAVRRHYAAFCAQPSGVGAISANDVFSWIAIELWARRFAAHLRAA
jgi:asparagine synthase (glutamine-hydrolysing)